MQPRRLIILIATLVVLSGVFALSGLPAALSAAVVSAADRWRAGFYALGVSPEESLERPERDVLLRLSAENAELRRRIREYDSIHSEVGTSIDLNQLLRTRLVARSEAAGRHFVEIDAGALDGISAGDPVLVGWTLVGVVRGERGRRSLVQLLSDNGSRVAVALYPEGLLSGDDITSDLPVVQGVLAGVGERYHLKVIHVEARSSVRIEPGMQVVTSGLDESIPYGLAIGEVVEARPRSDSELWDIEVQPLRPWGSYPTVLVLRQHALDGASNR